jgi:hypothetical protein
MRRNVFGHCIAVIKQFWALPDDDVAAMLPVGWTAAGVARARSAIRDVETK